MSSEREASPRNQDGAEDTEMAAGQDTDHDWEWRRKIRANPHSHLIYRIIVGIVGLLIVILGLILVPFPGPGWLVVLLGLAIWASEFEWAQRLLHRARNTLDAWTALLKPQPWWVKALVGLLTAAVVAAVLWLLVVVSGVPRYLPDVIEDWLKGLPGVG